jgi:hypothetical protein
VPPFFDGTNALHTIWKVLLKKKWRRLRAIFFSAQGNLVYKNSVKPVVVVVKTDIASPSYWFS